MTKDLMLDWKTRILDKYLEDKDKDKYILVLDNFSSHKVIRETEVNHYFLPPNSTSLL